MKKDHRKSPQIMLIDNDKYVRESLGTFFGSGQLKFLIFKSAAEGLNALRYQDIDVVISDYFLPDMDGLTFLKQVAGHKPSVARILMATIVSDELRKELSVAGVDALIEKPLSVASIDQVLCKINEDYLIQPKPETNNEK
jgi:DNA-binding NtrC family response regulator